MTLVGVDPVRIEEAGLNALQTQRAFLQVNDDDNAAALAVYREFGFATAYTYHYRAWAGECA